MAEGNQAKADRAWSRFGQRVFGCDFTDAALYHLVLDSTAIALDDCGVGARFDEHAAHAARAVVGVVADGDRLSDRAPEVLAHPQRICWATMLAKVCSASHNGIEAFPQVQMSDHMGPYRTTRNHFSYCINLAILMTTTEGYGSYGTTIGYGTSR